MAETPDATTPLEAAEAPAKKKGKAKLFIILGAVLILLSGGGAAAYFTLLAPAPAAANAPVEKKPIIAKGLVNFEPFVVNLADAGGKRFLRINVRLLVPEEAEAKEIDEDKVQLMRLRAAILELLTAQTSDQVSTPDGKAALKHAIIEHAKPILDKTEVTDVLFSDFVVQYLDAAAPFLGMLDVRCQIDVIVGHGSITVRDCLKLQRDSIIRLQETAGDDLLVQVQGVVTAAGEIVVDDETTSVKITEILPPAGSESDR